MRFHKFALFIASSVHKQQIFSFAVFPVIMNVLNFVLTVDDREEVHSGLPFGGGPSMFKYFTPGYGETDELYAAIRNAHRIEATVMRGQGKCTTSFGVEISFRVDVRFYKKGLKAPTYTWAFGIGNDSKVYFLEEHYVSNLDSFRERIVREVRQG